jgi:hypothetical protein
MSFRRTTRVVGTTAAAVLLGGLFSIVALSGVASAGTGVGASGNEVPNSAVPSGSYQAGTPFSSGQIIDIVIPANTVLTPGASLDILECADPGGSIGGLPTSNATCDGATGAPDNPVVNSDGSVDYTPGGPDGNNGYPILSLPNNALGEPPTNQPVCNLGNPCVLYIGQDETSFSAPHFFSQPFLVQPNAGNTGADPGDGTPEVPMAILLPILAIGVVGGTLVIRRRRRAPTAV